MANLKNVIYLSNEDYETLVSTGTVIIDGETLTYDENNVYVTPDKLASSTEDGLMSSSDKLKLDGIASGAEVNVQSDWNVTDSSSDAYIKNKPSIPTVNDGTLTIQKNGTNVQTFTANQSGNVTANITVPTKVSELANDSQYVKNGDILVPGSGYRYTYNGQLDDAFWSAAKRYYITCSIHPIIVDGVTYPHVDSTKTIADDDYIVDSAPTTTYNSIDDPSLNKLFDGSVDTNFIRTSGDKYIKIRIIPLATRQDDYSPAASTSAFPGYPYGWFALSTYWGAAASRVQYATYNKHSAWPTGWAIVEGTKVNNDKLTWRIDDTGNFTRTVMDFWFIGDGDSSHTLMPTAIYWIKNRVTDIDDENSYFSKYVDETLTTDVSWKWHGTQTAKITAATGTGEFKTIYENGTSLADKYLGKTAKAADADKLDGADSSYYLNISATGQAKSGNLTLSGNTYIGDWTSQTRAVGDAPYQTKFLDFATRTGVLKHLNVFSGVGDYFYNADRKRTFIIRSTFKGTGWDSDTYKADFYTWGVDDMGSDITYLFDWDLGRGWCVLPSKVSASTPAIIEIKRVSRINYTDVLRLTLTGHNGNDGNSIYSGILTDYTIEVCTDYANDTWVTVVDRSNVADKIGLCPQYSLQTGDYTACFGIRLTITGCSVTGTGYPYIKITSMQLRDHRPDFTIPSSVGALSERGGNIYGDIILDARGSEQAVKPAVNDTGYLGGSSNKWHALYTTNAYADSVTAGSIKSTGNSMSLYVASSTGSKLEVARFTTDSNGGTEIVARGHLVAFGDDDSSNKLKPADQTGFSDLDAYYFNTGITQYDYSNNAAYKLSFPGKTGTIALTSDLPATQQWKLTSTSGAVTTVNICTK